MARPELGTKRVCPTTGRKFYDLNRDPIISPYTGEALPRSILEPPVRGAPARPAPQDDEEDTEVVAGGPEVVSLEEVEVAEEEAAADVAVDDVAIEDPGTTDDTFLEEEEEGEGDVSDLIDGDLEEDEET
ncbi:MAG: TIGR02300 family protein [Methylobacteriaceae bacterium]|nr:TIGR02300 family protein [Methylobacteriaceae bacterium]